MIENEKYLNKIDEVKTEIHETLTEIKSRHYDDKIWKQSLINVCERHLTELIELESELN
jgi:hypothetical protein